MADKMKAIFKILFIISLSFILCACQMDSAESVELSSRMEYTQDFDNEYSKALNAYDAFMRGETGINNNPTSIPTMRSVKRNGMKLLTRSWL